MQTIQDRRELRYFAHISAEILRTWRILTSKMLSGGHLLKSGYRTEAFWAKSLETMPVCSKHPGVIKDKFRFQIAHLPPLLEIPRPITQCPKG